MTSIERVCLGTNMADSNRRQGISHVGENQEFPATASNLVITTPRTSRIYFLLEINRPYNPGRPIVSSCEITETSAFMNMKVAIEGSDLCTSVHYKPTDS